MKKIIPVNTKQPKQPQKGQERNLCESCNERYCGNCAFANGNKIA